MMEHLVIHNVRDKIVRHMSAIKQPVNFNKPLVFVIGAEQNAPSWHKTFTPKPLQLQINFIFKIEHIYPIENLLQIIVLPLMFH